MTDTFKKLAQSELTVVGTAVLIYEAPSATSAIVKHIRLVNQSDSDATAVRMWHKNGTVTPPDAAYLILPTADIADGGWAEFEGTIILDAGDKIYASVEDPSTGPTGADVAVVVYGLEMA